MNKQEHIPITQQERDDDQEFQRKMKLNPFGFVDQPLPRTRMAPEVFEKENVKKAKEYYMKTRGSGRGTSNGYDHITFLKIIRGIYE